MLTVKSCPLKLHFAERLDVNGSVGLIVLETDLTTEHDFRRLMQQHLLDFDLYVNRIRFVNPVTIDNLRSMLSDLEKVSSKILPDCPVDTMVFACTAASAWLGDEAVTTAIQRGKPGASVITTAGASASSLTDLGKRKISVLTPYSEAVSQGLVDYFSERGLNIVSLTYLDIPDDRDIARLDPKSLIQAAKEAMSEDAGALFVSCTALRTVDVLDEIQDAIGRPVISSNQATFWQTVNSLKNISPGRAPDQ